MSRSWPTVSLTRILFWLSHAIVLLIALTASAQAATVRLGSDDPCSFILEGPIVAGDLDRLTALGADFHRGGNHWNRNGYTWEPTICLDSPGGSLNEGIKIARFVYEGRIQTRIGDGSSCHSICAMIFMMGSKGSGPTTVEENRILHIGGDLAFHSPSIIIEGAQTFSAKEIKRAYDLGVESIFSFVKLANSRRPFESSTMIHPGLLQTLLDTPASDLLHITTIEQALSWDIGLEGVPEHLPQMDIQRLMTCENGLSRGFRPPSDIYSGSENHFLTKDVFALAPLSTSAQYRLLWDYAPEDLAQGLVFSFRYWDLPVECQVKLRESKVEYCGFDSRFQLEAGDCQNDYYVPLPHYARYHPLTEFRTLRDTGIAADVLRAARCSMRSGSGAMLRDAPCTQAIDIFQRDGRKFARHTLHWADGAQTQIEIATKPGFGIDEASDIFLVDGGLAVPTGDTGSCLLVPGNGQTICVTAP